MDRERIERQLKLAENNLAAWTKQLDTAKVAADQRGKNAKWRQLDGERRTFIRRILAVKAIEDREAAAHERLAERAGAAE